MGRKGREKAKKREEKGQKKKTLKNVPKPEAVKLDTLDVLNILTRVHLAELLKQYELVSAKHNILLRLPVKIPSCRDLGTNTTEGKSRFEFLKYGFASFDLVKKVEVMTKSKKNLSKLSPDSLIKLCKKNLGKDFSNYDFNKIDQEALLNMHKCNLDWFITSIRYEYAGFDGNRFAVVPSASPHENIFDEADTPNRVLQETLFSLKEKELVKAEEKEVRILNFDVCQWKHLLTFELTIPDICEVSSENLSLHAEERTIDFYAEHTDGKIYLFELSNLAYSIIPTSATYFICERDTVKIVVEKKKRHIWKDLFDINPKLKSLWEKEMEGVLEDIKEHAIVQLDPLNQIWNVSQIFANGGLNLLKVPFDLNHLRMQFESLEEMIYYYKNMIVVNPTLKALIYMLGAAVWKQMTHSRKHKKMKLLDEDHKLDVLNLITKLTENYEKNFHAASPLFKERKFEEAYPYFRKALFNLDNPSLHIQLSFCLFEMKRYREGLIHAIFVLRNIGPIHGFEGFILCLQYEMLSGYSIIAVDLSISLSYYFKRFEPTEGIIYLKGMRQVGLNILKNTFAAYSLIFRKKFVSALPLLQYVDSFLITKSGLSSVILFLLYFITKKFGEAIELGKLILKAETKYQDLVYYILGKTEYYLENLDSAINYFGQVECDVSGELTRVKVMRELSRKAVEALSEGNWKEARGCYDSVLLLSKDNDKMQSAIQVKLEAVDLVIDNKTSSFFT